MYYGPGLPVTPAARLDSSGDEIPDASVDLKAGAAI